MRGYKFIILNLIISLMLLGGGYAAWAENMDINTMAETGELSVTFADDGKYPAAFGADFVRPDIEVDEEDSRIVHITLSNLYPGAWAAFSLEGINSGSIPASFDNMEVSFGGDTELLDYLTYSSGLDVDTNGDRIVDKSCMLSGALKDFAADFNTKIKDFANTQLESNGSGCFFLGVPSETGEDLDGDGVKGRYVIINFGDAPNSMQGKNLTFTFKINFKQFNQ